MAIALEESAAEPRDAHRAHGRNEGVIGIALGTAVGVEAAVEERFEHPVEKVGLLFGRGGAEEVEEEVVEPFAPLVAEGHAEPALLLHEVEEDDAAEEFFDVVADGFFLAFAGFGGVGGTVGAGEVGAHGGVVHHEVDEAIVVLFVAVEELAREGFDGEGLAEVVDVEEHLGVGGAAVDEFAEVFGRRATSLPRTEEESEALGVAARSGIVGFVAEGETPLPVGATFVVDEEKSAAVGVHEAAHELLHSHAVLCHAHAVGHGDVEDVERLHAEVDVCDARDAANARGLGHRPKGGMIVEEGLVEGVLHVFFAEEGRKNVGEEGFFAREGLLEEVLEVVGGHEGGRIGGHGGGWTKAGDGAAAVRREPSASVGETETEGELAVAGGHFSHHGLETLGDVGVDLFGGEGKELGLGFESPFDVEAAANDVDVAAVDEQAGVFEQSHCGGGGAGESRKVVEEGFGLGGFERFGRVDVHFRERAVHSECGGFFFLLPIGGQRHGGARAGGAQAFVEVGRREHLALPRGIDGGEMGALVGRVVETERTRLLGLGSDGEGVPVFQPREVGIAGGVLIFVAFQLIEIAFQLRTHAAALEVETVVHHFLIGGEDAAVFAEEMVEGLQLGVGVAHEPNGRIAFAAGHEVVDIDALGGRAETVDATDALHQAGGVPRRVVVEDRVGAV